MPGIVRNTVVGAAIITEEDDHINKKYCEKCMKLNNLSILQERLYLDDKGKKLPPPMDAEDWLQCWTCGFIIAVREAKTEGELTGIIETDDNPFEYGKAQIEPIDFTKAQRKKKQKKHPDPEIQKELSKGAELISYQSSTGL